MPRRSPGRLAGRFSTVALAFLTAVVPAVARAQATLAAPAIDSAAMTAPASAPVGPAPVGPTLDGARVGAARTTSTATSNTVAAPVAGPRAGRPVALMGVGAAALVIGLVIGGTGGKAVAVGGAVIGLAGLYEFLR